MKSLKLILGCFVVGALVALIYYGFEASVRHSIDFIWNTLLDTSDKRLRVIPLTLIGALLFFGLQHYLDPKSEKREARGLGGGVDEPTFRNLVTILFIGYFSLLAGASLGPEAVLVPACMVAGALVGKKAFRDKKSTNILAAAGLIALMASFFHSFWVGLLALFLVKKEAKIAITAPLVLIAIVSSASAAYTLNLISPSERYLILPHITWKLVVVDVLFGVILLAAGYLATFGLKYSYNLILRLHAKMRSTSWWQNALIAGSGLSILYVLGGTLVQFTGNESIVPMLQQASTLGFLGLIWILCIKIVVIGWSKAMGYRGGLVFPMVFVASTLAAIAQSAHSDVGFGAGLVAALIGILAAERKAKILF